MTTEIVHRIETEAGYRLHVSRRNGGGTPVLFLNSFAADHSMWDSVRARLDRTTVAYDARGHGKSDIAGRDLTLDDLVADARAVIRAEGLQDVVLCGLSLGGMTAMRLAADPEAPVAGLVLANTAVNFPPPAMWQERARTARAGGYPDLIAPTLERWLTESWRTSHPQELEQVREMLSAMPCQGYADACAALAGGDTSADLAAWTGPTLIIAGAHDASSPVARSEEMAGIARDARFVVLDAAHVSAIEDPDNFAAALEGFIAELEGADA